VLIKHIRWTSGIGGSKDGMTVGGGVHQIIDESEGGLRLSR